MPATIADLRGRISIDGVSQAKKDLSDLKGSSGGGGMLGLTDSFKTGLGAVTGFMAGFAGFQIAGDALGFVKDQLGDLIQVGMTQQQVEAQTAAAIKSTGGAAGFTVGQIGGPHGATHRYQQRHDPVQ